MTSVKAPQEWIIEDRRMSLVASPAEARLRGASLDYGPLEG
jgi:hypothetical protein